jgi:hypothetical protein
MTRFCIACGLPLDPELRKWNRKFEGKESVARRYCNDQCAGREERSKRPRNKAKYGVAGRIYW